MRKTLIAAAALALLVPTQALAQPACMPKGYSSGASLRYLLAPSPKGASLKVSHDLTLAGAKKAAAGFATSGSTFVGGIDYASPPGVAPTRANLKPDYIHFYQTPDPNPPKTPYVAKAGLKFSIELDGKVFGPWPAQVKSSPSWTSFNGALTSRSAEWGHVVPQAQIETLVSAFLAAKSRQMVLLDGTTELVRVPVAPTASGPLAGLAWGEGAWPAFNRDGTCSG